MKEFDVILACWQSPIVVETVTGHTTVLEKYRSVAKPGDRIVVKIKRVRGTDKIFSNENSTLQLRVK